MSHHHKQIRSNNPDLQEMERRVDRRHFLTKTSLGLGALALQTLMPQNTFANPNNTIPPVIKEIAPKAKRVVYLFQSGGPSHLDLFDYKPKLKQYHATQLPSSVRKGQRLTGMSTHQTSFPVTASKFAFQQHGQSQRWLSELLPYTAEISDELCYIKSMHTEAINHDPAITFFQTGSQLPGRPSIGSWVSYGLGSEKKLNDVQHDSYGDPEILSRMAQYEMAFRMQSSIPELMDMSEESDDTYDMYGEASRNPGSYAANCLLARRLLEKGVKFVQLYHQGWDQHLYLPGGITNQCRETDQASAALVKDLKQRGLLDDTLVIWGGEFGRTVYSQGKLTQDNYGRDHHPKCFTIWMAGAGVKKGISFGQTDDFGYNIAKDPVHVHDFQATLLHLMGVDHEKLIFKHQGRRYRLTDVHGSVVQDILS